MPGPSDGTGAGLLPAECPNCGRLHQGFNFDADPGPVQRERDEWKSLCLDMGEALDYYAEVYYRHDDRLVKRYRALLARLNDLAGDSNPRHGRGRGPNEKGQT